VEWEEGGKGRGVRRRRLKGGWGEEWTADSGGAFAADSACCMREARLRCRPEQPEKGPLEARTGTTVHVGIEWATVQYPIGKRGDEARWGHESSPTAPAPEPVPAPAATVKKQGHSGGIAVADGLGPTG